MFSLPIKPRHYLDNYSRQFASRFCTDSDCICNTYISAGPLPGCNCFECKFNYFL